MQNPSTGPQQQMGVVGRTILGTYMALLSILLVYLLFELWPAGDPSASGKVTINLFGNTLTILAEVQLILVVAVVAALGSNIHTATSFADYVGNRRLYNNWVWWYILRLFVGVSLALIFYFVVRGGLLSAGSTPGEINTFGIAALSGLVGMFSKQATDKLRELFDTLFRIEKPDERADNLTNPVPQITNIEPSSVRAGTTGVSLTIDGNDFVPQSVVRLRGIDQPTKFVNRTRLTVTIAAADVASAGEVEVTVFNPSPAGGISNAVTLKVA